MRPHAPASSHWNSPPHHKTNIPPTQNDNVAIIKKDEADCDDS